MIFKIGDKVVVNKDGITIHGMEGRVTSEQDTNDPFSMIFIKFNKTQLEECVPSDWLILAPEEVKVPPKPVPELARWFVSIKKYVSVQGVP